MPVPKSSRLIFGRPLPRRRPDLEGVIVFDPVHENVWVAGRAAGLHFIESMREEAEDPQRRIRILRLFAAATTEGGSIVPKSELGVAAYGSDYGPLRGVLALDGLMRSLTKLFREEFEIEPIRFATSDTWEWSEEWKLREGTIRKGEVVSLGT